MRKQTLLPPVLWMAGSLLRGCSILPTRHPFSVAFLPLLLPSAKCHHLQSHNVGHHRCSSRLSSSADHHQTVPLSNGSEETSCKVVSVSNPVIKSTNNVVVVTVESSAFDACWNATTWSVNPCDSEEVNRLLQCFNSPAPQVYFALTRALATSNNTLYVLQTFSCMLKKGFHFQLRRSAFDGQARVRDGAGVQGTTLGVHGIGGGMMEWRIVPTANKRHDDRKNWETIRMHSNFPSTLSIAHFLLECSQQQHSATNDNTDCTIINPYQPNDYVEMVDEALARLHLTLGIDIRGRLAADTAFAFAMAGVDRPEIFQILARISYHELRRIGRRPSFPSKSILQIVEKLAASGIQTRTEDACNVVEHDGVDIDAQRVYLLASTLLEEKPDSDRYQHIILSLRASLNDLNFHDDKESMLSSGVQIDGDQTLDTEKFGLHSTRPLLWLWRFAARQTKARILLEDGQPTIEGGGGGDDSLAANTNLPIPTNGVYDSDSWVQKYRNASLPLIVDLGCGMGVSLLGLSTMTSGESAEAPVQRSLENTALLGQQCNYVGCDLSRLSINYASGIARRWGIDDRLRFVWKPAVELLHDVYSSYTSDGGGNVAMIMIQFPTPYRLVTADGAEIRGVDEQSIAERHSSGSARSTSREGNKQLPCHRSSGFMANLELLEIAATILRESSGCLLLLQSNCEDVAVTMRRMAVNTMGMEYVDIGELSNVYGPSSGTTSDPNTVPIESLPLRTREWISMGGERAVGPGWFVKPVLPRKGQTETEVNCELQSTPVHRCLLRVPAMKGNE